MLVNRMCTQAGYWLSESRGAGVALNASDPKATFAGAFVRPNGSVFQPQPVTSTWPALRVSYHGNRVCIMISR